MKSRKRFSRIVPMPEGASSRSTRNRRDDSSSANRNVVSRVRLGPSVFWLDTLSCNSGNHDSRSTSILAVSSATETTVPVTRLA
eukprot:scaffold907_cov247-Pinguiococcus_pyrenoidosus.AAC.7